MHTASTGKVIQDKPLAAAVFCAKAHWMAPVVRWSQWFDIVMKTIEAKYDYVIKLTWDAVAKLGDAAESEVLPVSGTTESLILSHRKDLEDGSIEVEGHASAIHE